MIDCVTNDIVEYHKLSSFHRVHHQDYKQGDGVGERHPSRIVIVRFHSVHVAFIHVGNIY